MTDLLIPKRYNVIMQDLSSGYLDLVPLGYVNNLSEAITMVKIFREALQKQGKNATVFFQLADIPEHENMDN